MAVYCALGKFRAAEKMWYLDVSLGPKESILHPCSQDLCDTSEEWNLVAYVTESGADHVMRDACLLCLQDPGNLLTGEADGYVSGQIFYDVFKARGNSTAVPVVVMGIPAIAMFLTGMSSVTANSRWDRSTPSYSSHHWLSLQSLSRSLMSQQVARYMDRSA